MANTIEQQVALDEALVPSAQRLRIGRSNFRLPSGIQSKESILQVVYDVLRQSLFFKAFLVTADVPEIYMQEFWATAMVHQHSIRFKLDTRKHIVDLESFREMLHMSPRIPGQSFAEIPFEEEILEFLRFLGHSTQIKTLIDVNVNKLYQPWRSFAAVINKCLTGKVLALIVSDLVYQVEHKNQKKSNEMYYPRFTKVIIHHFMTKKPSIPRRNRVNWHYVRDDILFSTIKVVSRHQTTQQYGTILPIELTTEDIRNNKAYKEYYACPTGEATPKPKASAKKKKGGSVSSTTPPTPIATPTPTTTVVAAPRLSAAAKGKQPARATTPTKPTDVERTKAEQLKIILKRSRQETHISQQRGFDTDEGTGSKPGVPNVPSDDSEEELSWNSFDDEDVDEQTKGRDESEGDKTDESDDDDDQEEAKKSDEGDDEAIESERESEDEETREQEEESFDPIPRTPKDNEDDDNNEEDQGLRIGEEERMQEEEEADELYHKTILESYGESVILKRRREDDDLEGPSAGSNRGSKRQREGGEHASASTPSEPATGSADRSTTGSQSRQLSARNAQSWISALAKRTNARSSFNELLDTPIDFSNFIMNWLGVDTLTPELLAGPTYELMRGSCNSLTELEYHLEEVYKATTDQLDWVNPEGQQYLHNLLQPLPLIPDNRGHSVIPFEHFINNDLEYLRGGDSSRKYTTSVTKTKAADYGYIKWIKDLVPRAMWIQEPISYDKHALLGSFSLGAETLAVLWVCRKLSNLTVEERFAFNVSLRMFTRSIVIQRRVEDLQLGVESYQKRLNLTKPDTYRFDLKRRKAYTAYSNPRRFIYQNKDKKNRLMRIDELHKFSDGTLNDVHNALDDRLKGIRMQYLPTTIWRRGDKNRAAAMIQAINKMLKTRRIMRSLERFVGGRQYEGDFRMLQGPYDSSYAAPIFNEVNLIQLYLVNMYILLI
nr:hypothetical protein [Tanacetum cinerariifolium]